MYDDLVNECYNMDINVIEKKFKSNAGGLCVGNVIAINSKLNENEKVGILAEEIGHFLTTVGDIIDLDTVSKRQSELKARKFAHELIIGLDGFVDAYKNGCRNLYDTADFLNVSTDFLQEAINQYSYKFGKLKKYENYIIVFMPVFNIYEDIEFYEKFGRIEQ